MPVLAVPAAAAAAAWPLHRRPLQAAVLLLAVLLLHGWVLWAVAPRVARSPGMTAPQRPPTVQWLTLAPPAKLPAQAATALQPPPADSPADPPADPPADKPVEAGVATAAADKPLDLAATARPDDGAPTSTAPPVSSAAEPPGSPSVPSLGAAVPETLPARGDVTVPVYATRLPASAHLHYELRRGAVFGGGQLLWRRQGDAYEISLEGELQGMPVLGSVSRGAIDADGVAPLRLAERRRSRELRAANFQRDTRRITFSGPQTEYPLVAGAQDRLSWMIQLPGIVEADPAMTLPGARVTLFVVGTRGDAEAWHFEVQGSEALELPAGAVANALHLLREPTRPYDSRVEVWLDPARQHLPVRAVITTVPGGQPLEFRLSRAVRAAQ